MARLIFVIAFVAFASACGAAATLGSIVSSFFLPCGVSAADDGLEYAAGYLWTWHKDFYEGAGLKKLTFPDGLDLGWWPCTGKGVFSDLTYGGGYFWIAQTDYPNANFRLLKIDADSKSIVSTIPIPWLRDQPQGLAWDNGRLWINDRRGINVTYLATTTGSCLASYGVPYGWAHGIVAVPGLVGGTRVFEAYEASVSTKIRVYRSDGHGYEGVFNVDKFHQSYAYTWDGSYLWMATHPAGVNGALFFRIIAWPLDLAVTPTSIGKIKALLR